MDEREKIIRENYPVEKLPEDLRAGLGDATRVRVTVEAQPLEPPSFSSWSEIKAGIEELHRMPGFKAVTVEEAVARVRALRDEWD
jgi:hypothetical protein